MNIQRTKSVKRLLFILLCASHPASSVWADGLGVGSTEPHRADAFVEEALKNNPQLNIYIAEVAAARAGRKASGTFLNPELEGEFGRKEAQEAGSGESSLGSTYAVSIQQTLEWPGRRALRKAVADGDIELAELNLRHFRNVLAARVRARAFEFSATRTKFAAAREVAARLRSLNGVVRSRGSRGAASILEARILEAAELLALRKAGMVEQELLEARLELNQLRGAAPDAALPPFTVSLDFRPLESMEAMHTQAREKAVELQERRLELKRQKNHFALAKNERYPSVSIGPTLSEERGAGLERSYGLKVSLSPPLWNLNGGAIAEAEARLLQAQTALDIAERGVLQQLHHAAATYKMKLEEMEKWPPSSTKRFRDAAEMADRRYRLGAVPIGTFVEMQEQYLEAVDGLLDTEGEALGFAQDLEMLTGVAPPLAVLSIHQEKP